MSLHVSDAWSYCSYYDKNEEHIARISIFSQTPRTLIEKLTISRRCPNNPNPVTSVHAEHPYLASIRAAALLDCTIDSKASCSHAPFAIAETRYKFSRKISQMFWGNDTWQCL